MFVNRYCDRCCDTKSSIIYYYIEVFAVLISDVSMCLFACSSYLNIRSIESSLLPVQN